MKGRAGSVRSLTWVRLTRLARLPGRIISPCVHMRNFSPASEMRKLRPKILGTSSRNKALTKASRNTKNLTFAPYIASATLKAVSLQLNGMLMMWKIQQATQEDAILTARIHPACVHIYCVLPSKPWESLRRRYVGCSIPTILRKNSGLWKV